MFASYGRKRFVPIIIVIAATLVVVYQINRFDVQIISNHHQEINAPKTLAKILPTTGTVVPSSSDIVTLVCGKAETVCTDAIDDRIDCFPNGIATEAACEERGCCWRLSKGLSVPSCFFPVNYGYRIQNNTSSTSQTFTAALQRCSNPDYKSKGLINIMASIVYHHHPSMLQLKVLINTVDNGINFCNMP